jgi:arsenite methyltransferase
MATTDSERETLNLQLDQVQGNIEAEVLDRYGQGAQAAEAQLCCPVEYDASSLELLPQEIIEKDYGCGDPSKHVRASETVLDLGSGGGKICYILSKVVGKKGRVIGVDFNDKMLTLARKYQNEMAQKYGFANVKFVKGKIQDLSLDLDKVQAWLEEHPIRSVEGLSEYENYCNHLRGNEPMIAKDCIDVIVSNCVLNLVRPQDKKQLFQEMFRVVKPGGRVVISDIVCDRPPTEKILQDPQLWSGCISGAFLEDEFLEMFVDAGFYGVEILARQEEPWHTIEDVEFRSLTVRAFKGKQGPCLEREQALVYKGPFKSVCDDDDHAFYRGQRMAVCDKTFKIMTNSSGPYSQDMIGLEPDDPVSLDEAQDFNCSANQIRDPRQQQNPKLRQVTTESNDCNDPGCC